MVSVARPWSLRALNKASVWLPVVPFGGTFDSHVFWAFLTPKTSSLAPHPPGKSEASVTWLGVRSRAAGSCSRRIPPDLHPPPPAPPTRICTLTATRSLPTRPHFLSRGRSSTTSTSCRPSGSRTRCVAFQPRLAFSSTEPGGLGGRWAGVQLSEGTGRKATWEDGTACRPESRSEGSS